MNAAFRDCVDQLWSHLNRLTPIDRYRVILESFGFRPLSTWLASMSTGTVRAGLATAWETLTETAVPISTFAELFQDPLTIALRTQVWKLAECETQAELSLSVAAFIAFLQQQTNFTESLQRSLFQEAPAESRKSASRSVGAGEIVSNLHTLVAAGKTFPTIYADPPWPYDNEASRGAAINHYPVMSLEEIRREPVPQLAAKNAHLHLWTTNGFLCEAIELVGAWGFELKSCLVWVKPDLGCGNYWRVSHEFLLLGVRGRLPFRDRSQRSWISVPRMEHSRKPGRVRLLIEQVSPGPYLELFGRAEIPDSGWTVYGNRVERRLF